MKLTTPFELELEVQYDVFPPSKGRRDSLMGIPGAGAQLEPDYPGGIEIVGVYFNGIMLQLSADQIEELTETVILMHHQL